jgi:hypothetical protein
MNKQIKAYQYIIGGLILLNVLMIGWQWFGPLKHPPRPEEILRKELQLTDEQMNSYRELIREHRIIADPLENEIRVLRKQLLNYNEPDSSKSSLADAIGKKQSEFETTLFEHFKKVRALCTDEQKKKFDDVLLRVLAAGRPPKPKPRD